jgi:hypothetical protein
LTGDAKENIIFGVGGKNFWGGSKNNQLLNTTKIYHMWEESTRGDIISSDNKESSLAGLRVLDIAEGGCQICGKILGELGADVGCPHF